MQDMIVIAVILAIVGGASLYIYCAKKRGARCIGCPAGESCSRKADGASCSCGCGDK